MTQILPSNEYTKKEIENILHPLVREWFFTKFEDVSLTQKFGVIPIWNRQNILISAPTGGTKTLTSFLSILNYLVLLASKNELEDKIYAVYTSPLKALSNDISKNLIEPLKEIQELASSKNIKLQDIRVGLRTGDTTANERAKMSRKSPHIFITTPESLAIVLTTPKFIENLHAVEFCIVDEIHSFENKRGTYLSLTLERLNEVSKIWPVKIGLSATVEPIDEIAKFLVGMGDEKKGDFRDVIVAKVPLAKKIDVKVLSPVKDLIMDVDAYKNSYDLMDKLISEHKTTLVFTNTRSGTERVVNYLKDKFPLEYGDDNIAAHHSSLSKEVRFDIEERLRDGKLKVVVCSTSLELGIDIGFIDLVLMLGSPKSSARALQRLGRAGHKLHEIAKGRFIILDRDDLIECCVIQKEMIEKKINKIHIPKNSLDVLAQQIYGMAIYKVWDVEELFSLIKKSYCFNTLSRVDFFDIISYLSGEYDLENNNVYGKIWYDLETKQIGKKGKLARVLYMTNIGTIPDESFIKVKLAPEGNQIGAIDEGFLERMKKGDVFVLGGKKYLYAYTKGMNLYVKSATEKSPTIPSWFSEMLPLSFDSACEIGRFRKLLSEKFESKKSKKEIIDFIKEHLYISDDIIETPEAIYNYFLEQHKNLGIPHTHLMYIERYTDFKTKKNYAIFHSMYGRRVNDVLSRAFGFLVAKSAGRRDVEVGMNDNGFYIAGDKLPLEKIFNFLTPKNLEEVLKEAIERSDVLDRRFRHCATRSLMILRSYKGNTRTVGKQQMKSHFLINAVKKISREFPILREARREILEDLMDIENAKDIMKKINNNEVKIKIKEVDIPSPFALNLITQAHTDLIRLEDKQDFLKRMHKLHLAKVGEYT